MDDFLKFNFIRVDASGAVKKTEADERVDLIARQFRDFLFGGVANDDGVHGIMISNEFMLRRRVSHAAGWMSFLVDVGDGKTEKLEEAAVVVFIREPGDDARAALDRVATHIDVKSLPPSPLVVVVELTKDVPFIIREWYTKAAAGFFAKTRQQ
jgi:hypothetical protein